MLEWRLYYDDGSTFSNEDGAWTDAPKQGVISCNVLDKTGTNGFFTNSGYAPRKQNAVQAFDGQACPTCRRSASNEVYVMFPGTEEPMTTWHPGPFEDWMHAHGYSGEDIEAHVKLGRLTTQENWAAIQATAGTDPDFPMKTSPRRRNSDHR